MKVFAMNICALSLFLLSFCPAETVYGQEQICERLTLELTITDEGLPEEYLLVMQRPFYLTADYRGNIYVLDELRIKVFDREGRPKKIVGRPGQGPGELAAFSSGAPVVSPTGYISINNYRFHNVYDAGGEFLRTMHRIERNTRWNHGSGRRPKILVMSENEYVADNEVPFAEEGFYGYTVILEHIAGAERDTIAVYREIKGVSDGKSMPTTAFCGHIFWDVSPDRTVVYYHSRLDERSGDNPEFAVHTYALDSGERRTLLLPFTPVSISDEMFDVYTKSSGMLVSRTGEYREGPLRNEQIAFLKEFGHYEPFGGFSCDGEYLAVRRQATEKSWALDIIDMQSGLKTGEVPDAPYGFVRNGRIYSLSQDENRFYRINVYRIDPALYAK